MCAVRNANVSTSVFDDTESNICSPEEGQGRLELNGNYDARQLTVSGSTVDIRSLLILDLVNNRDPPPSPLSPHRISYSNSSCSALSAQQTSSRMRFRGFDLVMPWSSANGRVWITSYRVWVEGNRFTGIQIDWFRHE